MAFKRQNKNQQEATARQAKAQQKVNQLVDQGVAFNPTTINEQSLQRAAQNLGGSGSIRAQVVGSRGTTSATAKKKKK